MSVHSALAFAAKMHGSQTDKAGNLYMMHVVRVWLEVAKQGLDEDHQMVALLHDVVEDTGGTLADIGLRYGNPVTDAVDAITKRKGEILLEYYARVRSNPIAHRVKLVDVADNRNRLHEIKDKATYERLQQKYSTAMACLTHTPPTPVSEGEG